MMTMRPFCMFCNNFSNSNKILIKLKYGSNDIWNGLIHSIQWSTHSRIRTHAGTHTRSRTHWWISDCIFNIHWKCSLTHSTTVEQRWAATSNICHAFVSMLVENDLPFLKWIAKTPSTIPFLWSALTHRPFFLEEKSSIFVMVRVCALLMLQFVMFSARKTYILFLLFSALFCKTTRATTRKNLTSWKQVLFFSIHNIIFKCVMFFFLRLCWVHKKILWYFDVAHN